MTRRDPHSMRTRTVRSATTTPAAGDATAFVGELLALTSELGADERRVLLVLARRLLAGQKHYGRLHVAADPRDWTRERVEELEDALVYTAIALVKRDAVLAPRKDP